VSIQDVSLRSKLTDALVILSIWPLATHRLGF
jgi:hypothetical protein